MATVTHLPPPVNDGGCPGVALAQQEAQREAKETRRLRRWARTLNHPHTRTLKKLRETLEEVKQLADELTARRHRSGCVCMACECGVSEDELHEIHGLCGVAFRVIETIR